MRVKIKRGDEDFQRMIQK